jgi:lipoprotein-releasing system permease protein
MQGMPLSLLIGLRFSRGRRRSGMVSFISIISTIGIALGVAVLIVGLSAMNGFEKELRERVLAVVPHGEIEPLKQPYVDWLADEATLNNNPAIVATSPYITFTGLIENGTKMKAIQVRGVIPQQEAKISSLSHYVEFIDWANFNAGEQQIILGKGVAEQLEVQPGDWVSIMIPNHDAESVLKVSQPKRVRLQVVGLLNLVGDLGYSFGLVPLRDAQEYLDYGDGVSGIALRVTDLYKANSIVPQAASVLKKPAYVSSWMSKYGRMHRDIQLVRSIMYLAMILVIGVACFNIVSTLVMAVKDKSSDIAILRTLGATDGLIRTIFIWYGLLAGLVGSVVGVIIGVFASLQLTNIIRLLEKVLDHQFLSGGIYFIDFLPSELHASDVIIVLVTALVLSLLASWYPAQRASHINPARVLSGQ